MSKPMQVYELVRPEAGGLRGVLADAFRAGAGPLALLLLERIASGEDLGSGAEIAAELSTSRSAVWQAIKTLCQKDIIAPRDDSPPAIAARIGAGHAPSHAWRMQANAPSHAWRNEEPEAPSHAWRNRPKRQATLGASRARAPEREFNTAAAAGACTHAKEPEPLTPLGVEYEWMGRYYAEHLSRFVAERFAGEDWSTPLRAKLSAIQAEHREVDIRVLSRVLMLAFWQAVVNPEVRRPMAMACRVFDDRLRETLLGLPWPTQPVKGLAPPPAPDGQPLREAPRPRAQPPLPEEMPPSSPPPEALKELVRRTREAFASASAAGGETRAIS